MKSNLLAKSNFLLILGICVLNTFSSLESHAGGGIKDLFFSKGSKKSNQEKASSAFNDFEIQNKITESLRKVSIVPLVSYVSTVRKRALTRAELEIAQDLLRCGAAVDEIEPGTRRTSLIHAAQTGDLPLIELLIENGAYPRVTSDQKTVSDDAAKSMPVVLKVAQISNSIANLVAYIHIHEGRPLNAAELKLIEELLRKGADVNERTFSSGGYTPLMFAVQHNDVPLIQLLREYGADFNAKNGSMSVLDYARGDETRALVLESLKSQTHDLNEQ